MRSYSRRGLGAVLLFTVLALALLAAGCGGSSSSSSDSQVASIEDDSAAAAAETSGGTTGSEETDPEQARLDFAQCMRDNGVDVPDPGTSGGGGFQIGGEGSDVDPDDPDFQAAMEECGDILQQGAPQLSEEEQQAFQDAFLEYAQCMRDNGIDMPDPDFSESGGRVLFGEIGDGQIDPNDPDFQAAAEECRPILEESGLGAPGGPGGPDGETSGSEGS